MDPFELVWATRVEATAGFNPSFHVDCLVISISEARKQEIPSWYHQHMKFDVDYHKVMNSQYRQKILGTTTQVCGIQDRTPIQLD